MHKVGKINRQVIVSYSDLKASVDGKIKNFEQSISKVVYASTYV